MTTESKPATAADLAQAFFDRLSELDVPGFLALWADDGVWEFPYAPPGFPARLEGREAIREFQEPILGTIERLGFHDVEVREVSDTDVVAEFRLESRRRDGGAYRNVYIAHFVARDGRLGFVREFFDPTVLARAFELEERAADAG